MPITVAPHGKKYDRRNGSPLVGGSTEATAEVGPLTLAGVGYPEPVRILIFGGRSGIE